MPVAVDAAARERGRLLLETAYARRDAPAEWLRHMAAISELAAGAGVHTHVAFAGTAVLAAALWRGVDLRAIRARGATSDGAAWSARSLCHQVLVPFALDRGLDLGVRSAQPLNNHPYFHLRRLTPDVPVTRTARPVFERVLDLVERLQRADSRARFAALTAFLHERRRHGRTPERLPVLTAVDVPTLARELLDWIAATPSRGRRAQTAVAAVLTAAFPGGEVQIGRLHDPDRHFPGDVLIQRYGLPVEVRDRRVTAADVVAFAGRCREHGYGRAMLVCVRPGQLAPAAATAGETAACRVRTFDGLAAFLQELADWAPCPPERTAVMRALDEAAARVAGRPAGNGAPVRPAPRPLIVPLRPTVVVRGPDASAQTDAPPAPSSAIRRPVRGLWRRWHARRADSTDPRR